MAPRCLGSHSAVSQHSPGWRDVCGSYALSHAGYVLCGCWLLAPCLTTHAALCRDWSRAQRAPGTAYPPAPSLRVLRRAVLPRHTLFTVLVLCCRCQDFNRVDELRVLHAVVVDSHERRRSRFCVPPVHAALGSGIARVCGVQTTDQRTV